MANNVSIDGTWYKVEDCYYDEKLSRWFLKPVAAAPVAVPPKAITSPAENPVIGSAVATEESAKEAKKATPKKEKKTRKKRSK